MQSAPDGDYKFIFVYQDHLTKFVSLGALKTKTAKEVVDNIVSIFGTFGGPQILQTDNGREFANKLLEEAVAQWPGCKILHGKPRHSQSQGSVERANADIEDILRVHQRETKTTGWARFLPLIQYRKNIRFHSGIGRSTYVAMFGRGYNDYLGRSCQTFRQTTTKSSKQVSTRRRRRRRKRFRKIILHSGVEKFPEFANQGNNDADFQLEIVAPVLGVQKDEEQAEIDCLHDSIMMERHGAHSAQKNQARKMLHASEQNLHQLMLDKMF
ncbi:unnamed protein product, partial [Mesorhabditis belari]|uniref:Integrase catalytic domain-containing protein n=1 Tax=Mesorhabditis belari TaxID=2138241 RepID=A0AAF3F9B7_9BILA